MYKKAKSKETQGHVETEDTKTQKKKFIQTQIHTPSQTKVHTDTQTQEHVKLSHRNKYIAHNPILYSPGYFNILEYFWERI